METMITMVNQIFEASMSHKFMIIFCCVQQKNLHCLLSNVDLIDDPNIASTYIWCFVIHSNSKHRNFGYVVANLRAFWCTFYSPWFCCDVPKYEVYIYQEWRDLSILYLSIFNFVIMISIFISMTETEYLSWKRCFLWCLWDVKTLSENLYIYKCMLWPIYCTFYFLDLLS